ncbi:MAG: glycerophosphodiester phosphodiesterase [Candidatus Didemnitutus sp.]|nr:glycerophosphodiester phosphodiesterase [Candidatus Didemnitutus sp.]
MPFPLIIAHRGASAEKPENTQAAFRRALALRVDGIELDVHLSRDGVPVVFHDATLHRLAGVRGRVTEKSWREISLLRVHGTEPIPRLVDVLRLTRGRAIVQIELKTGATVAPVLRAVKTARAMDWVVFASFGAATVKEAARLAPSVPRMLISEGQGSPASLARRLAACSASGLSVNHRAVRSAAFVSYFHARSFSVWCWTVNDSAVAIRLVQRGVDGILGDNPALLHRAV